MGGVDGCGAGKRRQARASDGEIWRISGETERATGAQHVGPSSGESSLGRHPVTCLRPSLLARSLSIKPPRSLPLLQLLPARPSPDIPPAFSNHGRRSRSYH